MYPLFRLVKEHLKYRNAPPLAPTDTHCSRHMCLPWDIDPWMELNNGRTLTLFDLGRIPLATRTGLVKVLKENRWGLTVAGSTVRYRRRIRMFEVIDMRSRLVTWDERFIYIEQSMWKQDGEAANQVLIRGAITGKTGIVPPAKLIEAYGTPIARPTPPAWVQAWIEADAQRPWPPEKQ